ncbi:hypothetical protein BDA96_01G359900 [Sorghum bicolor]|uniref:Uncharacterized protein n=2 Tax=Sorghum bicolor TaxID=4558 RepID=A0A921S375_SORBI|nr:hypothetical protein BDA96_01G359900 [Sorghum bicolor]KXG39131.1 hypothetical protein SORBI_3001G336400 [Sorghum bicolor]
MDTAYRGRAPRHASLQTKDLLLEYCSGQTNHFWQIIMNTCRQPSTKLSQNMGEMGSADLLFPTIIVSCHVIT